MAVLEAGVLVSSSVTSPTETIKILNLSFINIIFRRSFKVISKQINYGLSLFKILKSELISLGTGKSCKEKTHKENFQMCLSLIFYNYKFVFKVRISSPLQT